MKLILIAPLSPAGCSIILVIFEKCPFFKPYLLNLFLILKDLQKAPCYYTLMKKLFTNLTFWVLTAITLGVLLGHFRPDLALMKILEEPIKGRFLGQELEIGATFSEMLGKTFISVVKLFINPIIFLTITLEKK